MDVSKKASWWIGISSLAGVCLLSWTNTSLGQGLRPESVGVRGGFSANESGEDFNQADVFGDWNLPWGLDLGKGWHLQPRLDFSVGWLGDRENNGAIGTIGPSMVLQWDKLPVSLEAGSSPTFLSTHDFGSKNFGTDIQFTSHVGLNWDFAPHWQLGYRFQHMSNAGLADHNPGLNLHMFALSYRF